jgi:hypothetical protein
MGYDYSNRISKENIHNALLRSMGAQLTNEDIIRLNRNTRHWNFYDGFHWEEIGNTDKPQVTVNYVRAFVDKFVSFELGNGFTIKMKPHVEKIDNENDPLDFLNEVWEYNNKLERSVEIGQAKAITGDAWVQVSFEPKLLAGKTNPNFIDPFDEYDKGKIKLTVLPSSIVFPVYSNAHNKDEIEKLVILYPITQNQNPSGMAKNPEEKTILYKQEWTSEKVSIFIGDMNTPTQTVPNKYKMLPFRQIKNFPQQGRNEGLSDMDDIIPINMEINLKKSDISEIIDYHSAPVTVVYGARIGQLERGANKVWGGLPKDARIENLRLEGDLNAAQSYITELKKELHEVGNIPEGVLGGTLSISNTSGVALQIALMPILERTKIKQVMTKAGLQWINKTVLLVGEKEGLIKVPEEVTYKDGEDVAKTEKILRKDFFYNEIIFDSILPKDSLLELQEVEMEMRLGLTSREDAMKRRGKSNIQEKIANIDVDMKKHPTLYGQVDIQQQIELMKEQAKLSPTGTPTPSASPTKPIGTNKDGKTKQINAGYQNSPVKK